MVRVVAQFCRHCDRYLLALHMLAILALFSSGCFRYTPSRAEMESAGETSIAGPEAFLAHQAELQRRLDNLLKERAPLLDPQVQRAYRIGAGDVLKIDVFGFSDLSGEMEVSETGTISLPLVGPVEAAGKEVSELQKDLAAQYSRYVKNPKVRLTVDRFNAYRVSVVGSVPKPGFYPLKRSGYLLTELLSEVGGTKENSEGHVYLIPARKPDVDSSQNNPTQVAAALPGNGAGVEIELEALVGTLDKPPLLIPLLPGDTVIVPDSGQFRVDGEVERPGSFPVSRRTSTLSAIAAAGGFTYAANVNEVEVVRDIGAGKKASMTVDLEKVAFSGAPDVTLKGGDVVIVPSSPGRFRARQVVESFRSIMRGGVTGSIRYQ